MLQQLKNSQEVSSALQMELFDADAARLCLQGKRIVMLGDSTMTEAVHDLVMLISGLAHWPDQINTYVYNATRYSIDHRVSKSELATWNASGLRLCMIWSCSPAALRFGRPD